MVLEKLYEISFLRKRKSIAILLGIAYSTIGIGFSFLLFPEDPALIAIAFISLISLVSLSGILIPEGKFQKSSLFNINSFLKENRDIYIILLYLFLGVLLTFAFFSIFMHSISASELFSSQAEMVNTFSADEMFNFGTFSSIYWNNIRVLLACVISSFLFGIGTIFLFVIIWNASVIGVVFGLAAKNSAISINQNPFYFFLIILLAALPHILLEISSYFIGGIAADKFSTISLTEKSFSKNYLTVFKIAVIMILVALVLLAIAAVVETVITPRFINMFFG